MNDCPASSRDCGTARTPDTPFSSRNREPPKNIYIYTQRRGKSALCVFDDGVHAPSQASFASQIERDIFQLTKRPIKVARHEAPCQQIPPAAATFLGHFSFAHFLLEKLSGLSCAIRLVRYSFSLRFLLRARKKITFCFCQCCRLRHRRRCPLPADSGQQ